MGKYNKKIISLVKISSYLDNIGQSDISDKIDKIVLELLSMVKISSDLKETMFRISNIDISLLKEKGLSTNPEELAKTYPVYHGTTWEPNIYRANKEGLISAVPGEVGRSIENPGRTGGIQGWLYGTSIISDVDYNRNPHKLFKEHPSPQPAIWYAPHVDKSRSSVMQLDISKLDPSDISVDEDDLLLSHILSPSILNKSEFTESEIERAYEEIFYPFLYTIEEKVYEGVEAGLIPQDTEFFEAMNYLSDAIRKSKGDLMDPKVLSCFDSVISSIHKDEESPLFIIDDGKPVQLMHWISDYFSEAWPIALASERAIRMRGNVPVIRAIVTDKKFPEETDEITMDDFIRSGWWEELLIENKPK